MRPLDALLLCASGAGIVGLAWASDALAPPTVPLADLAQWDGRAVAVEGFVVRAARAGSGAQVLSLADGSAVATVFWPDGEPVEGAVVRAEGGVARHLGRWEVVARRVEVLAPADAPLEVPQAARLAPALQGRAVAVLGALAWPGDGEPALAAPGARLALDAPRSMLAQLAGARVVAEGVVRYDAARAAYLLDAWEVRAA